MRLLRLAKFVKLIAQGNRRHSLEVRLEYFRPRGHVGGRGEIKPQSLKAVVEIDSISEKHGPRGRGPDIVHVI